MEVISLDEELICAVCRDIFVEPVTLPCGHNYCEGCVKQLKRSAVKVENINAEGGFERLCICYTCPLCLAPCDSTLNLKNNVVLNNIIEKYHSKRASGIDCTVCKGDSQRMFAEKSCVSCEESYCTVHIIPHLENAVLRQHVLVSPMGDTGRLCKEHGKEQELYCETDQTPLCAYCMLSAEAKHLDGHNVVKLADALDTLRGNCHVKLQGIKERLTEVKNGLAKIDEAASRSKASLERQQSECTAFLRRIKLFLEFEEQAWQKRFSVEMVQESRNGKQRTEGLRRLQDRLTQAQDTLLKTQTISDPLVLLQLLKNEEWADLLQRDICSRQMQKLSNWSGTKLVASSITPLFQTLQKTFQGDVILFSELSAHPKLKLDPDSGSVWVTEEDQRHEEPCYLDRPYCVMGVIISSKGVHNWEVEVEGLSSWAVGVAFLGPSQIAVTCKLGSDDQSWSLSYSKSKQQFSAQHDWLAFAFHAPDSNPPRRIGVFLDVDSGILSFYDAVRMACLYTFYCTLDQDSASQTYLRPAFCPRLKEDDQPLSTKPMRVLRPVSNF